MKIWPGPKTCLQCVLFDKTFPHRAKSKLCELKCYEAANVSPPLTQLSGSEEQLTDCTAHRGGLGKVARGGGGGLGPKVSQPHDLRICIISKRHVKEEHT
jgi:hypothetical protein